MTLEQITTKDKLTTLEREKENIMEQFSNNQAAILKERYAWPSDWRLEFYLTSEKKLSWFSIQQNSFQPLDEGEVYIAALPCGFEVDINFSQIAQYDKEKDDSYVIDSERRRVYRDDWLEFYFSDECDLSCDMENQEEEFSRRLEAEISLLETLL